MNRGKAWRRRGWRGLGAALASAAGIAACQEKLTAPGECPDFCPGGYEIRDTVLLPLAGMDSSYEGYLLAGQGASLRVSDRLPASEDRAILRFSPRGDSILVDSLRPYTIDSVALELSVVYRDTLVSQPIIYLFRLPAGVDSTTTFAQVESAFSPASIVDSFVVPDSLRFPRLRAVFDDSASLARVAIPPADSGVLALGVKLVAPSPTGIRIGSAAGGSTTPRFVTYVTVIFPDSTAKRAFSLTPRFNTFVSQNPPPLDPNLLTVGGAPSARSLVRFPFPARFRDSVTILRATLDLVPAAPIEGLRGDSVFLEVRPVLADLGAKSPVAATTFAEQALALGAADTVSVEVVRLVRIWQSASGQTFPPALVLRLIPEAQSFTRVAFGSSRTPGMVPALRVTYALNFPFANP